MARNRRTCITRCAPTVYDGVARASINLGVPHRYKPLHPNGLQWVLTTGPHMWYTTTIDGMGVTSWHKRLASRFASFVPSAYTFGSIQTSTSRSCPSLVNEDENPPISCARRYKSLCSFLGPRQPHTAPLCHQRTPYPRASKGTPSSLPLYFPCSPISNLSGGWES